MSPTLRKLLLTTHIVFSVGWLGTVAAYLALALVGLANPETQIVRAVYISMGLLGWYVIIPFSLITWLTGLVQALGTPWGLFRHWWISAKFVLTTGSIAVLFVHIQAVTLMSNLAANTNLSATDFRPLRVQLVLHPAGGLLVLLAAAALSVYKPWGMTPYGRRKAQDARSASPELPRAMPEPAQVRTGQVERTPRWIYVVAIHAVGLALVFAVWHLSSGGMRHH